MFPEDLFTVVVQRRPVASGLLPCVDTRQAGGKIQIGIVWMGLISLEENI